VPIRISMKFSNNTLFYPDNKALDKTLESFNSKPDSDFNSDLNLDLHSDLHPDLHPDLQEGVTAQDNFSHTRGNFEQYIFGTDSLETACQTLESELTGSFREQAPLDWALTQNNLGNIFAALGQTQNDDGLYENSYKKAIQSFQRALEELNQENAPLDWAATQYNLGTVTHALGRQLSDTKLIKKAVDAYTDALLEWTREKTPLQWASTMHQLGATFHTHGLLLKGNRTLQKSVVAYKNALVEFDADNTALELVATHNNRGVVLQHLGESEENSGRLEEAIRAYEKALLVSQEQQLPIHLAVMTKVNIATARAVLAELKKDLAIAQEAADDFELIIELFHNACQPDCLKHCKEQLDNAQTLVKAFSGNK